MALTRRTVLGAFVAACAAPAHAGYAERIYLDGRGHAIRGYDPVAYLDMEEALRGTLEHALETPDGTWLFRSEAHLAKFRAAPERYAPQFGGYDAHGMARGFKRISDPTLWIKIDGKIYLHYTIRDQNRWAADIRKSIEDGERNWTSLRDV